MVSFQCDGCADVVKKPKLDQHRGRCGASFTCIDCSRTFPTPVEWKGHTSCISEAEKYQKSLYKPKPNGGGRENPYANGSGGKFQGRGGSWNRPPPRSQATGANDTPLGTPPRMSPVTAPPLQDGKTHTAVSDTAIESVLKKEPKKHKKRKSEVTDVTHVEASYIIPGADDPISREEPKGKERNDNKEEGKKEKKEKKDKHEKAVMLEAGANGVDPIAVSPADVKGDERPKKSKKDKKEWKHKHKPAIQTEGASNGVNPATLSPLLPLDVAGDEKSEKSKKQKKESKHKETRGVETGGTERDVPVEAPPADVDLVYGDENQKKKKRKSKIARGETEVNVNGKVNTSSPSTERESKKRKREAEEQEVLTGQEAATERERKKKKKVAVS